MSFGRLQKSLFIILIALLLAPAALSAQSDINLSKSSSVVLGGLRLTADYPASWFTEVDASAGILYIASSEDALEVAMSGGSVFAAGDVAVSIIAPATLDSIGIDTTGEAVDVLSSALDVLIPDVETEISPFGAFGTPGAIAQVVSETPPTDVLLVAFQFELGTVIAGIQPSNPDTVGASEETKDIVEAIMQSVTLTDEAAQSETEGDADTFSTDVELETGTFTFSIAMPEEWVNQYVEDPGAFYMASSDDALELVTGQIDPDAIFEAGEVAISIAMPGILELMGLDIDADPADAVTAFAEQLQGEIDGEVQLTESAGIPIALASVAGAGLPGGTAELAAVAFDAGTILIVISPGGSISDTVIAALDSIRFGDQGAPVEVAEPEPEEETAAPIRQWASDADGTSQYGGSNDASWGFDQATGEPDTDECGDRGTAWASAKSNSRDILTVSFDMPVIPTEVNIYQSFNPGAIVQIEVANSDNPDLALPIEDSADPEGNTDCPGVFTLDLSHVEEPIDRVVIYLDQELTGNWNEIDAVELVGVPAE